MDGRIASVERSSCLILLLFIKRILWVDHKFSIIHRQAEGVMFAVEHFVTIKVFLFALQLSYIDNVQISAIMFPITLLCFLMFFLYFFGLEIKF